MRVALFCNSEMCSDTRSCIARLAGFGAFTRSTLFGGFYELLDHTNGYTPNPSWWLGAILNKQIFSFSSAGFSRNDGRIWTYKVTSSLPTLRAFVFSTGEVVSDAKIVGTRNVALLVNLASTTVEVKLSLSPPIVGASAGCRSEWELTAPAGDLHSQQVLLNGASAPLTMGADGSVDPSLWAGLAKPSSEPIVVAPFAVKIVSQQ